MAVSRLWFWAAGVVAAFGLPAQHFAWVLGAVAAALLLLGVRPSWRAAWWLLAGLAYGVWRIQLALWQQWPAEPEAERVEMVFQVASVAEASPYGVRFEAWAHKPDGQRFRLLLTDRHQREWLPGSRWRMTVRVRPTVGERNGNGFDREAWALSRGIDGLASAPRERQALAADTGWYSRWQQWRGQSQQQWQQAALVYPQGAALMRALGSGGYGGVEDAHWQAFRVLGINHLVSISGLHIGMVALAAAWWARWLLLRLPLAEPRRWYLAIGLAAALGYGALAGFGVPVQRSLLMLSVFAWSWWRHSGTSPWQSWLWALSAVLLLDPLAVLGVGFWLSFGTVAVLIWAAAWRLQQRKWQLVWRGQYAASLLGFWSAGQLFGVVPLAAPLANLLLIPWFSWVLVPLALLALVLPLPELLHFAAAVGEYTLQAVVWAGEWVPSATLAHLPWPFWLGVLAALAVWLLPRGLGLRPWAAAVLLASCLYQTPPPASGQAAVRIHDVGQGLAVQVRTRQHWLLFDTGTAYAAQMQLLPDIWAQGLSAPDVLVLSHHDADHNGGLAALQNAFALPQVYAGQREAYAGQAFADCQAGRHWEWDGVWFEFLTPPEQAHLADNDQSCVLRVVAGGQALLVSGDLGVQGERALVAQYGGDLYSQLLVLGHHGSRTSSAPEFLAAVKPQVAVATSGFANAYGHPSAQVRHSLSARGIRLYTSARSGQLDFVLGSEDGLLPQRHARYFWQRKPFADE